jgi:hypothetical protein
VRGHNYFLILLAVLPLLSSCTSTVRVAGYPTFGRIQDVSAADIEAAVSAYAGLHPGGHAQVGDIEVVSHDEIDIYMERAPSDYTSMIRVKGKWQQGSVVLVHPRY